MAELLSDSIGTMHANSMLAMMRLHEGKTPPSVDGFALLESSAGFWILKPCAADGEGKWLTIEPISAQDCITRISDMVQASE